MYLRIEKEFQKTLSNEVYKPIVYIHELKLINFDKIEVLCAFYYNATEVDLPNAELNKLGTPGLVSIDNQDLIAIKTQLFVTTYNEAQNLIDFVKDSKVTDTTFMDRFKRYAYKAIRYQLMKQLDITIDQVTLID